jgi:hypothetical protein
MSVIQFPGHRTQPVQQARETARTTCYNLAAHMRDDLLTMGLPVWQSKEIRDKIEKVVDDYRNIVLDFYGAGDKDYERFWEQVQSGKNIDDIDPVGPDCPIDFADEKCYTDATNYFVDGMTDDEKDKFDKWLDEMAAALLENNPRWFMKK